MPCANDSSAHEELHQASKRTDEISVVLRQERVAEKVEQKKMVVSLSVLIDLHVAHCRQFWRKL